MSSSESAVTAPRVLLVYYTHTQQAQRVCDAMAEVFRGRGCDVTQAAIEFTEPRYVDRFAHVPLQARRLRHRAAARAAAAPEDRPDRHPGGGASRRLRPGRASARRPGSSGQPCRSARTWVGRGGEDPGRQAVRRLRRLPPLLEHQPQGGQEARDAQGGEYVDGIHFTYEGGQIRSLLSLLSYFGKGEMRERSLGIKIPPTNLKPDFGDQARPSRTGWRDNRASPGKPRDAQSRGSRSQACSPCSHSARPPAARRPSRRPRRPARPARRARPSLPVAKRGVVTIQTAIVGDPGNPSVGVWQVFKTVGNLGRERDAAAEQQHGHLQELRRRSVVGAELPDGRRGQGHLRDRRVRDHRLAVRDVPEHGRSGREEPAPALRGPHESHGLAEVRLDRVLVGRGVRPALFGRLSRSGLRSRSTSGTSGAEPSSSTRSSTARSSRRPRRPRAPSSTSPTRCGSRPKTEQGMYDMRPKTPTRPRRRDSSSRATTSGSRPPTTTRSAVGPTPTGSTRPARSISRTSPS